MIEAPANASFLWRLPLTAKLNMYFHTAKGKGCISTIDSIFWMSQSYENLITGLIITDILDKE